MVSRMIFVRAEKRKSVSGAGAPSGSRLSRSTASGGSSRGRSKSRLTKKPLRSRLKA